jgi:hypothetical protein
MRIKSLALGAVALLGTACADSVRPGQQPKDGEHVFRHLTPEGDTIALYATIRNAKVANARHVQNGALVIERVATKGRPEVLLHVKGRTLRAKIPMTTEAGAAFSIAARRLAEAIGPASLHAQSLKCAGEWFTYGVASAAVVGAGYALVASATMPAAAPAAALAYALALDKWDDALTSVLECEGVIDRK